MAEQSTNETYFMPEQYNSDWSHDILVTRYIDLYVEYCALRTQIDLASNARPLERERTIHNLFNARLRLEHENQRLQGQNRELRNAIRTNTDVDENLRKQCTDTEDTLRAVLEARTKESDDEVRAYKERVAKLQEENKGLRKSIQNWNKSRDEEEKLRIEMGTLKIGEPMMTDRSLARQIGEFEEQSGCN